MSTPKILEKLDNSIQRLGASYFKIAVYIYDFSNYSLTNKQILSLQENIKNVSRNANNENLASSSQHSTAKHRKRKSSHVEILKQKIDVNVDHEL